MIQHLILHPSRRNRYVGKKVISLYLRESGPLRPRPEHISRVELQESTIV